MSSKEQRSGIEDENNRSLSQAPSQLEYGDESNGEGTTTPNQLGESNSSNSCLPVSNSASDNQGRPATQEAQIHIRPKQFSRSIFTIEEESIEDRSVSSFVGKDSPRESSDRDHSLI